MSTTESSQRACFQPLDDRLVHVWPVNINTRENGINWKKGINDLKKKKKKKKARNDANSKTEKSPFVLYLPMKTTRWLMFRKDHDYGI